MATDNIIERFRASLHESDGKTLRKGEELQLLALKSPAVHFALFTTITDKDKNVRQPTPNILQLRMSQAVETMRELGIRVRVICVKPRQTGCSTFACHIGYHRSQRFPTDGLTISDTKDHAKELKEKLAEFTRVDTFPWGSHITRNPSNETEWSNGSKWTVDTAENPDAGVGGTRQFLHASEVAKWPQTNVKNDMKTMTAAINSLSGETTEVIVESTPEGAVGYHYKTWQEAITIERLVELHAQGFRQEVWVKVFAAWFEFPEHSRKEAVSENEIKELRRTLTDHERDEIRKYKLSWEQVAWRRDKIRTDCGGDPRVFSYYFPSDEVTCWLASGSPRFDMGILHQWHERAQGIAPTNGYLVSQDTGKVVFQSPHDGSGDIQVWEAPKEGLRYLVSLDPATDASQTITDDPDSHSVTVWRDSYTRELDNEFMPVRLVARVRPRYFADGDEVAGHVVRLSKLYGQAIVSQEVNCGLDIMAYLKEAGIPLYKRRPLNSNTREVQEQYGFKLKNEDDRNAIIERLAGAIRNQELDIACPNMILEMKMFVRKKSGRAEAAGGAHDDDVMGAAMAWETMPSATLYRKHVVKEKPPRDRSSWRQSVRRF